MFTTSAESSISSGDPFASILSTIALLISVLAVIVPALTGRQQRRRDDRATRSEMYLELMELVERHGLWVTDRTYDLIETSDNDVQTEMPHRNTARPDRTLRVRARAIVSAYASTSVSEAYASWQEALEAFEQQLDNFSFEAQENGPWSIRVDEAKPMHDAELAARELLATVVNAQLVQEQRWRRS